MREIKILEYKNFEEALNDNAIERKNFKHGTYEDFVCTKDCMIRGYLYNKHERLHMGNMTEKGILENDERYRQYVITAIADIEKII